MRRRSGSGAFTLLEVLVATALIAILAASLYASLSIAFRARRSAQCAVQPVRKAHLAMELLAEDIRGAAVPKGILAGPFVGEDGLDEQGRPSDRLAFYCVSASPVPAEGVGDIKKVELGCEPADDGRTQVLVRLVTTNLQSPRTVEPQTEVLCRGVLGFNLRYFDGADWYDTWDSTTVDNALPAAVELMIQLADERPGAAAGEGYLVWRVILVPCAPPPTGDTILAGSSS